MNPSEMQEWVSFLPEGNNSFWFTLVCTQWFSLPPGINGELDTLPFALLLLPLLPRPHEHELGRLGVAGAGGACWLRSVSLPSLGPATFQARWEGRTALRPPTDWSKGPPFLGTTPRNLSGAELLSLMLPPMEAVSWGLSLCVAGVQFFGRTQHAGSLSPSVALTPSEARTGQLISAALGGPSTRTRFRPIPDPDKPQPLKSWAAATPWPSVPWDLLLAKVPKPWGKQGTERWVWRVR